MLTTERRKPGWLLYPGWVVLSALSIPLAWGITWVVISQIEKVIGGTIQVGGQTRITEDYLASFILFPLLFLFTGLLQYLILGHYLTGMGWWIPATALSWLLPLGIMRLVYFFLPAGLAVDSTLLNALLIALMGSLIGLSQWLVLRKHVRQAGWWILACAVGWGLVFLVTGPSISSTPDVVVVALLPPLVTCLALWALLDWLPQRD